MVRLPRGSLLPLAIAFVLLSALISPTPAQSQSAAGLDFYGDPLPAGAVARLGTIRFRHGGEYVHTVAFSPDGRWLATGGRDFMVRIWDSETGRQMHRLPGHRGEVRDLAFLDEGLRLASTSWNNGTNDEQSLRIWNAETGQMEQRIALPQAGSLCVAVSPDGNLLATARRDGEIDVWDRATGETHTTLSLGSLAARSLVFLNDGQTLAAATVYERKMPAPFRVALLDLATGKRRREFEFKLNSLNRSSETDPRTGAGCLLALDRAGESLAIGTLDGTVRFYDVAADELTHEISGLPTRLLALAADGRQVARGQNGLTVRDAGRVEQARQIVPTDVPVSAAAFSADGEVIATAGDTGVIQIWDVAEEALLSQTLPTHDRWVKAIAFSPDGQTIVTGGMENRLRFWEAQTGKPVGEVEARTDMPASTALQFTPDGSEVVLGVRHNRDLVYLDPATGELTRTTTLPLHGDAVALSADGRKLLVGGMGRGLQLVDVESGVRHATEPEQRRRIDAVALAADGRTAATASRAGGRRGEPVVILYDVEAGQEIKQLHAPAPPNNAVYGADYVEFSPSDDFVAAVGQQGVLVWDVASGSFLHELPVSGSRYRPIDFAPDGKLLATCRAEEVVLYEVASGAEVAVLTGHETYLTCIKFHAGGRLLASGAWDGTTLVWNLDSLGLDTAQLDQNVDGFDCGHCWEALASDDAASAHRAIWALVTHEEQTLAEARNRLQPAAAPALDAEQLARWIDDLDADDFAVRERASRALTTIGPAVRQRLEHLLREPISLEVRSRIERLLRELEVSGLEPDGNALYPVRAVRVLELIASPAARELLGELAGGDPAARLTNQAVAAVTRLDARAAALAQGDQ